MYIFQKLSDYLRFKFKVRDAMGAKRYSWYFWSLDLFFLFVVCFLCKKGRVERGRAGLICIKALLSMGWRACQRVAPKYPPTLPSSPRQPYNANGKYLRHWRVPGRAWREINTYYIYTYNKTRKLTNHLKLWQATRWGRRRGRESTRTADVLHKNLITRGQISQGSEIEGRA